MPEPSSGARARKDRARLLLVEDDYLIGLNAEMILTDAGHEVLGPATTADEAIALAEAARPDLVLMDIRLAEGSSGLEAAAEIFQRLGIRSLFVSAHADDRTREQGNREASPVGWLAKPYSSEELGRAVTNALLVLRGPSLT
ncbi:response regulator [Roseococcus sp. MDT2-1-1]|uniref:Response regulator n=1 Tax=Sabulicella glaciei TaxID=2984948 RepID=A0ABT3NQT0_9PROT|nr:response regulator [Roseococcus sp. MDT2-1-1]